MLDDIGAGATATTDKNWQKHFAKSDPAKAVDDEISRYEAIVDDEELKEPTSCVRPECAKPLAVQIAVTVRRIFIVYRRDPIYLASKLGLTLISGFFMGSNFYDQGAEITKLSLQNKLLCVFMSLLFCTALVQQLHPVAIAMCSLYVVRERPSKMSRWSVFVLSVFAVEVPWNIIGGTLFWLPW